MYIKCNKYQVRSIIRNAKTSDIDNFPHKNPVNHFPFDSHKINLSIHKTTRPLLNVVHRIRLIADTIHMYNLLK